MNTEALPSQKMERNPSRHHLQRICSPIQMLPHCRMHQWWGGMSACSCCGADGSPAEQAAPPTPCRTQSLPGSKRPCRSACSPLQSIHKISKGKNMDYRGCITPHPDIHQGLYTTVSSESPASIEGGTPIYTSIHEHEDDGLCTPGRAAFAAPAFTKLGAAPCTHMVTDLGNCCTVSDSLMTCR